MAPVYDGVRLTARFSPLSHTLTTRIRQLNAFVQLAGHVKEYHEIVTKELAKHCKDADTFYCRTHRWLGQLTMPSLGELRLRADSIFNCTAEQCDYNRTLHVSTA